jgi:hypothetical protein
LPGQRAIYQDVRRGIEAVDAEYRVMARRLDAMLRQRGRGELQAADLVPLRQMVDQAIGLTLGGTRNAVRTSSLYRSIVRSMDGSARDVYRRAYGQLRLRVESRNPLLWARFERMLSVGARGDHDRLTWVYRMLRGDHVAERRLLRAGDLHPQRIWVPAEKWNTRSGYRLSDRVWNGRQATRLAIDDTIRRGIAGGMSALDIADELARYLNPDLQPKTIYTDDGRVLRLNQTAAPYGGSGYGSTWARVLVRTEMVRINGAATIDAAKAIPGVEGIRWAVSNRHTVLDQCDIHAASNRHGLGKGVYLPGSVPLYPNHPACICTLIVTHRSVEDTIDEISGMVLNDLAA